jgi:hypothetical protein
MLKTPGSQVRSQPKMEARRWHQKSRILALRHSKWELKNGSSANTILFMNYDMWHRVRESWCFVETMERREAARSRVYFCRVLCSFTFKMTAHFSYVIGILHHSTRSNRADTGLRTYGRRRREFKDTTGMGRTRVLGIACPPRASHCAKYFALAHEDSCRAIVKCPLYASVEKRLVRSRVLLCSAPRKLPCCRKDASDRRVGSHETIQRRPRACMPA